LEIHASTLKSQTDLVDLFLYAWHIYYWHIYFIKIDIDNTQQQ